jgi:prevent-host-death family protein
MKSVTIRELRNRGGDVVDRVQRGETLTVTRDGVPVAELRPVPRVPLTASELVERRRGLPRVDPERLRKDLDRTIDPGL